jgi:chromosome segregation ATPase
MGDDRIVKLSADVDQIKGSVSQIDTKLDKVEDKVNSSIIEIREHIASEAVSDRLILEQLSKIDSRLDVTNERLDENNGDWREHMQRTRLNEEQLKEFKKISVKMDERLQKVEDDLNGRRAIKRFFIMLGTVVGVMSGIGGIVAGIYKIVIFLSH